MGLCRLVHARCRDAATLTASGDPGLDRHRRELSCPLARSWRHSTRRRDPVDPRVEGVRLDGQAVGPTEDLVAQPDFLCRTPRGLGDLRDRPHLPTEPTRRVHRPRRQRLDRPPPELAVVLRAPEQATRPVARAAGDRLVRDDAPDLRQAGDAVSLACAPDPGATLLGPEPGELGAFPSRPVDPVVTDLRREPVVVARLGSGRARPPHLLCCLVCEPPLRAVVDLLVGDDQPALATDGLGRVRSHLPVTLRAATGRSPGVGRLVVVERSVVGAMPLVVGSESPSHIEHGDACAAVTPLALSGIEKPTRDDRGVAVDRLCPHVTDTQRGSRTPRSRP